FAERHGDDVDASMEGARALLPELRPENGVGVAATITSLAALDLGLDEYDRARVHGHVLTRDGARAQLERLAALSPEERRRRRATRNARRSSWRAARSSWRSSTSTTSGRYASASATSSTAPRSRRPSCRSPKKALRLPAPTPAARGPTSPHRARLRVARPRRDAAAPRRATGRRRGVRPPRRPAPARGHAPRGSGRR